MKINKKLFILIAISNLFFVLLYLLLAFNNRLTLDDFYFSSELNNYGFSVAYIRLYNNWASNWTSNFINYFSLFFVKEYKYGLFVYNTLNFILFIYAVFSLLKNSSSLLKNKFQNLIYNKKLFFHYINISIFVSSIIFITTIKIDETWFWLCASTGYLLSNIALILGTSLIISRKKNLFVYLFISISFIYIGGSLAPLALVLLLFFILLLIHIFLKNKLLYYRTKIIVAFVSCLIAFIIFYIGEGSKVRARLFDEISIPHAIILNFKMTAIIYVKQLLKILPLFIIFSLPMVYIGNKLKNHKNKIKLKLIISTILYVVIVYLYQLAVTYKTQDVVAYRALLTVTILTLLYFYYICFLIGQFFTINKSILNLFIVISISTTCLLFFYKFLEQQKIVSNYSKSYDERILFLSKNKKCDSTIILKPLCPSGMLLSSEISINTAHFKNQHLKKGLNLNCDIKLRKE